MEHSERPPTSAPPPPSPAPSAWPTALGTVAIVFGILGAIGSVLGVLMVVFQDEYLGLFGGMVPEEAAAEITANAPHPALGASLQILGLLAGLLLAVAGARLVKRRQCGASLLRTWAIIKIILVVIGSVVGARVAMAQAQGASGAGAGAPPPGLQPVIMIMAMGMGLLWGWALPVFSLVWLGRAKIRAEVAGWAP